MKTNFNFLKRINDFSYILPKICFTEQLSLPASEYTNKCDTRYCSVSQNKSTKNEHARIKRKKIGREKW